MQARALRFEKIEGLGNDFIVVRAEDEGAVSREQARLLCDRRLGVGADGVLLVLPGRAGAVAHMRVINADGSVPEMCGNGLRCVALALASAGLASGSSGGGSFLVSTDAGLRECEVTGDGARAQVTVDMGPVRVGEALDLEAEGVALHLVRADAGNPHAVTFDAVPEEVFRRVGLAFATHAAFPRGANIELTRVGPTGLDVVVWERGVGLTLACGTGACAALAVACAEGRAAYDTPTEVRLPGGALRITLRRSDGHALMEGPARRVFTGEVFVTG